MILPDLEDWTYEDCEKMAGAMLATVSDRVNPFDPHTPVETLLLASIAASTLAISKKTKAPVRKKT